MADRWHEAGGRVVGLLGHFAPRELVVAGGMLAVALDPARLVDPAGAAPDHGGGLLAEVLEGLAGELPAEQLSVISALLRHGLDWIDALLIGRDNEAHTKLFYVLREMASDPELGPFMPPLAFSDVLRLPSRTSAVYNRVRLRQLQQTVAGWAQREASAEDLGSAEDLDAAINMEREICRQLQELERLRCANRLSGSAMLAARRGARVLPAAEAKVALAELLRSAEGRPAEPGRSRIFLTGSEPTVEACRFLEEAGFALVGDDRNDDPLEPHGERRDPLDQLADRYQYSAVGAARAGLDRVAVAVERARALRADAIVALLVPSDEASPWELAEFRRLMPATPVISARLDPEAEEDALGGLVSKLSEVAATEPSAGEEAGADSSGAGVSSSKGAGADV